MNGNLNNNGNIVLNGNSVINASKSSDIGSNVKSCDRGDHRKVKDTVVGGNADVTTGNRQKSTKEITIHEQQQQKSQSQQQTHQPGTGGGGAGGTDGKTDGADTISGECLSIFRFPCDKSHP